MTIHLYGHVATHCLPYVAIFYSIMGVRGALALRKLAQQAGTSHAPAG